MADSSERKSKQSTLTSLAERVMGRWQQTPMNTIVQRAIRLADSAGSTPLTRAGATEGFTRRIIQAKSETNVWKPRATTKQVAIEGFTDALIQRFPDISAKYVARPAEDGSAEQPNLIYSGGNAATPTMESVEATTPSSNNTPTESETFDVNQLPSIPADVLARHKGALQKRSESLGSKPSPTSTSPRAMQRKESPPSPQLVRPRSKIDYIGSKASNVQDSTPQITPEPPSAPTNATPSAPIQAKAEEAVIQETTPLEEPKWRVRPRAGFQSIPSQATSDGGKSNSVPFAPIQEQKANVEPTPDGALSDTSIAPTTPIQRMAAPMQDETDNKGDDDFTDSSGGTPPDEPPPPTSLPPTSPVQLMPAPEAASSDVEMPLRAASKPPLVTPNPTEGATESVDAIQIPSVTQGVPAKAVRRTSSQTPPILRKPALPIAARPTPEAAIAPSPSNTPSPIPQKGVDSIAPIQRLAEEGTPSQSLKVSHPEQRENAESLYEDKGVSPSPAIRENDSPLPSAPVQRHTATEVPEPLIAEPNLPSFFIPEREAMPLRSVESDVAPLQRQAEPEMPSAIEATEAISPPSPPKLPPATPLQRRASGMADTAPSNASQPTTPTASSEKTTSAAPVAPSSISPQSTSKPNDSTQGESTAALQRKIENSSPVQRVISSPEASEGPIVVTPASPASPLPGREEMPLRTTDVALPRSDAPVQRQTEEHRTVAPPLSGDTEAVPIPSDTPPLQRVASEATVPPSSPSSLPAQSLPGEVVQRQAEDTIQRDVDVVPTPSVGTPPQLQQEMPSAPQTKDESAVQRVVAPPTATGPVEMPPTPQARDESAVQRVVAPPTVTGPVEMPSAPQARDESTVQRVVADVAPPTSTGPVEMPLRTESSALPTPLQRKEDDDAAPTTESGREATSSPTTTLLDKGASPSETLSVVQRQNDNTALTPNTVDVTPLPQTENSGQGISENPPLNNPFEGDTEAIQRLAAEPNLPASPLPSRSEMPLRHEAAAKSPVVQRQSDSEPQPTSPSSISAIESDIARSTSTVTAIGASDSTPIAQRKIADSAASEPYQQSVTAEAALPTNSPERPNIASAVMPESPIQRLAVEIPPSIPSIPTREEMPLRHEEIAAAPIQRQSSAATDESSLPNESEAASDRLESPISDLPVAAPLPTPTAAIQRVIQPTTTETEIRTESGKSSDSPASAATTPTMEGGKPIAPPIPLQRVSAENTQTPFAPTTPLLSGNVVEQSSAEASIVQRETGEFTPPQATLPTEADMPLRLPPQSENPLQRAAEEAPTPATTVPAQSIQSVEGSALSPMQRVSEPAASTPPAPQQEVSRETATPPPSVTKVDPLLPSSAKAPPAREDTLPVQRLAVDLPPSTGEVDMPLRGEPSVNPMREADVPAATMPDSATTGPVVEGSIEKVVPPAFVANTPSDNAPIQTFRANPEPTIGMAPSNIEMPLRSSESAAPPLQRKKANETNEGPSLSNAPVTAKGVAPLQRMETLASPDSETPREAVQSETRSAPPIELAPRSPIPIDTPLQRTAIPYSEDLEAAPSVQRATEDVSSLGTSSAQGTELPLRNIGNPSINAAPPPLQRVVAEPSSSEFPMIQRADMPLREDAPMIQRAIQNETTGAELAELPIEQTGSGATTIAPSPMPPLATTATPIPPLSESPAVPALPLQRKATVKATKIQRKSNALTQQEPLPVAPLRAPIQRQYMEAATKFANPTLTTLPLSQPSSETTDEGIDSNITAIPIQRWGEEAPTLPLQRHNRRLSPATQTAALRRSDRTRTVHPSAPLPASPLVQRQAMPLVQRVEDEVIVPPEEEEQEEVYIDLSHLFRENEDQVVYVSEEQAEGTGAAPSKTPSEADALQALQTLADEIYPLLKQMIARERERHRGF